MKMHSALCFMISFGFQMPLYTLLVFLSACTEISTMHKKPRMQTAVFAYILADNDLELFALRDINEMEKGRASIHMREQSSHLVAYMDKKNTAPQHGVVFNIHADTTTAIHSPIVRAYPEINSADPEVFSSILRDLMKQYPAHKLILIVWSHGTGWVSEGYTSTDAQKQEHTKSFGRDDSSDGAEMSIVKLTRALRNMPQRLHAIVFDACYMGDVEVAYELQDVTDYVMFSQAEIQHDGFPYDTIIPLLADKSIDKKTQLVKSAKAYYDYYNNFNSSVRRTATISIVKTAQLPALARAVKTYITKHGIAALGKAEPSAQKFSATPTLKSLRSDMGDLFTRIEQSDESRAVLQALKNAVLVSYNTDMLFNTVALAQVHGMSMYVPEKIHGDNPALRKHYKTLQWAQATGLDDAWN